MEWYHWIGALGAVAIILVAVGTASFKFARWTGSVDKDLESLKRSMKEVRGDIVDIRGDIKDILSRLKPPPVSSDSPLRLTKFGTEIAEDIEAQSWAERLAPSLMHELGGKEPFEIDRFCIDYVENLGPEWDRKIAKSSYEFGIEESGIKSVLQVVLREEILKIVGPKPKQNA